MADEPRTTTVEAPAGDARQVIVHGDVAVDGSGHWTTQRPVSCAVDVGGMKPDTQYEALVEGSARVVSDGLVMGVSCEAYLEGQELSAAIGRDVRAWGAAAWGVSLEAIDRLMEFERLPVSHVTVGGDVDVRSRFDIARGIHSYVDGTMNCQVQGSVTVVNENQTDEAWRQLSRKYPLQDLVDGHKAGYDWEDYRSACAFGIQVANWGQTTVGVDGDVRATSSCRGRCGFAKGVEVGSFAYSTRIVVGGDVVARAGAGEDEDFYGEAMGIYLWRHDGGDVFVRARNVVADGSDLDSVGISAYSTSESDLPPRLEVQVLGDVSSSGNGIMLSSICRSLAAPSFCVFVEGTVRAGGNGVCLGRREEQRYDETIDDDLLYCVGEPWGSMDVVVWRIKPGEGRVAVQADAGVERCVSYLVRVEQPAAGAAIRILSELEERSFRGVSQSYLVAHAGDVIRFAVDVEEGCQVVAVYGLQDGEPLSPEPDGTYQVTVPPEGGVCLRVV